MTPYSNVMHKHTNYSLMRFDYIYRSKITELSLRPSEQISILLPDGSKQQAQSWKSTPADLSAFAQTKEDLVAARVDGILWDLARPLEKSCSLDFVTFSQPEGRKIYWNSAGLILGCALDKVYPDAVFCGVGHGKSKLHVDLYLPNSTLTKESVSAVMTCAEDIIQNELPITRLDCSVLQLKSVFSDNKFMLSQLGPRKDEDIISVYRCGQVIDISECPHLSSTSGIRFISPLHTSSAHWEGKNILQRLYAVAFPTKELLEEYNESKVAVATKDHRTIGSEQELFFFHQSSPGSCFFLPKGSIVYSKLVEFIKNMWWDHGYDEVVTPTIFKRDLWVTSGHWEHYQDNMFRVPLEDQTYVIKPMNCPGHCLIYLTQSRSYRELPIRLAELGVVHRNEFSGALSGLTRVRRFQQDDAHIFCRVDQIGGEIMNCLKFAELVYNALGFSVNYILSTRPPDFMGSEETWVEAEKQLYDALVCFGCQFSTNPGDGAFYGPKIDMTICDVLGRPHQCGTIQLDFQLPQRFELEFINENQTSERPVIIHRAILGSIERMFAILCETYGGNWPFWLSPFQCIVISVGPSAEKYAREITRRLRREGYACDMDINSSTSLDKKILISRKKYNFLAVVGDTEMRDGTVNLRERDCESAKKRIQLSVDELLVMFSTMKKSYQ